MLERERRSNPRPRSLGADCILDETRDDAIKHGHARLEHYFQGGLPESVPARSASTPYVYESYSVRGELLAGRATPA